jgi:hypothetical protein
VAADSINSMEDSSTQECFKCNVCCAVVQTTSELMNHMLEVHTKGTLTTYCFICEKKFRKKAALRMHVMKCHSESRCQMQTNTEDGSCATELPELNSIPHDFSSEAAFDNSSQDVSSEQAEMPVRNEMVSYSRLRMSSQNPGKESQNRDICERIAAENNMVAIQVPGDGNCQYHAVLEGLKAAKYVENVDIKSLRQYAYEEIIADRERYSEFPSRDQGSIDIYARGVLGCQFGDELTLRAIASSLNIQLLYMNSHALISAFTLWEMKMQNIESS